MAKIKLYKLTKNGKTSNSLYESKQAAISMAKRTDSDFVSLINYNTELNEDYSNINSTIVWKNLRLNEAKDDDDEEGEIPQIDLPEDDDNELEDNNEDNNTDELEDSETELDDLELDSNDEFNIDDNELVDEEQVDDTISLLDDNAYTQDELNDGIKSLINNVIIQTWQLIDLYNSVSATLKHENVNTSMIDIIQTITEDEMINIGKLEGLLVNVAPEAENIPDGREEILNDIDNDDDEFEDEEYFNELDIEGDGENLEFGDVSITDDEIIDDEPLPVDVDENGNVIEVE